MDLASRLKNLAVKLEEKNNSLFDYPAERQKAYLEHFREPRDDIERAYFQYRCQMKFNNPLISFALNLASLPMVLMYLRKHGDSVETGEMADAVFFSDGKPENIIPEGLRDRTGSIAVINDKKESLTDADRAFFSRLRKRYPFSWQFQLKCLLKIRFYSYEIQRVQPKAVIVCNEYSFTCSVMTAYCEEKGLRHINVMHGEKLYYMRDSFFRFHECYVWDKFYQRLFEELRAEKTQFQIAVPPSLKFNVEHGEKEKDYTYYLGAEKGEQLRTIVEAMDRLQKKGKRVAIRPHPRYSDIEQIRSVASDLEIEDNGSLTIEQSLGRTEHAVSVYSTVLNQAFNQGIGIVIDDISDPAKYQKLKELRYMMLHQEHKILSELLEG